MIITDFINANVIDEIKKEIKNSNGNEVFFRGIPDKNQIVVDVEVLARGNTNSVAALINRMRKNEVIIHNHPSGMLLPSDADITISSMYGSSGGASYIINNEVDDIYVVVPLKKEDKINIDEFFGENGIIHKKISKFEPRNEQYEMSKYIEKSLNENKKIIVEAGTGTGKTIAYLLPTLLYALKNNLKAIISTNTINLQEQLIRKDIPLIKKIIEKDFKYEIVKGKGNYLCKRKLYNLSTVETEKDTEEERIEKKQIKTFVDWDKITEVGDRNELKYEVSYKIWEKVNCESDLCNGSKCPYYNDCYFFKARKDINEADLLIVNHHMFFADLAIRQEAGFHTNYSILPNYDIVVFDEAHNIEDTARNYFTYEISKFNFGRIVGNIYNNRTKIDNSNSSLIKVMRLLNERLPQEEYIKTDEFKEEMINNLNIFYEKGVEILDKIIALYLNDFRSGEIKLRIDVLKNKNKQFWNELENVKNNFKDLYAKLIKKLREFKNYIEKFDLEENDDNGIIFDFEKYFDRLKECYENFIFILNSNEEGYVYWFQIDKNRTNIKLYATPFDVSNQLNENLFDKLDKIIFTSATLAVDEKFKYFKESLGLDKIKKKIIEKIINSPFDYEKQMQVYIPEDTLEPNDIYFLDDVEEYLEKTIKATQGNCFLLFTSYSSMEYCYKKLIQHFDIFKYNFIKQGDYPRHEMIEIYKNSENPVLFGTDSFWEGVDVQGDKLKSVIIIKLPFKVPNDPVTEAIIENIKLNGKNPFNDYQVPQAVIKFKQGIGRLIRSKDDTGIITILDNRIIKKSYGKKFLKTLPKNQIINKKNEIIKMLKNK